MYKFSEACPPCVQEAAMKGIMEFTCGSESSTVLCARHKIIEAMESINNQMKDCEEEGDYMMAHKLKCTRENLKKEIENMKIKESGNALNKSLSVMKSKEKLCKKRLKDEWRQRREINKLKSQDLIQDLLDRQALEKSNLQQKLEELMGRQPPKLSTKVLEMRKSEKILAAAENYSEAADIKKIADHLERNDLMINNKNINDFIENKLMNLERKHLNEIKVFTQKVLMEDEASRRKEKEAETYLANRARATAGSLRHAFVLKSSIKDKSSPMILNAVELATSNSKVSLAAFNCYANSTTELIEPFLNKKRPQSAAGTMQQKTLSPVKRPNTSHVRLSSPPIKGGVSITCGHCAKRCSNNFVSIPPTAGLQFTGTFCSWECSKRWNNEKSPIQFRWIRNVLIDQAANYHVQPSEKKKGRVKMY